MIRTPSPDPRRIAAVRRFNRLYTQHLGVLQDAWLDSPFSLTEARVIYEIRERREARASDIGRDLGIDAGYLSRILRRLQREGLIGKESSSEDKRASVLSLTAAGRKAFAPLERRTERQVGAMLVRLSGGEQTRLVAAMREIERAIGGDGGGPQSPLTLREPRAGDLGWVVQRHAQLYLEDYGWGENFESVCADIVADFARRHDPARERCWIADIEGAPVGSVFLVRESARVARLRLLLVEPAARGRGAGRQLTQACVSFARTCGYRRITLWTHEVLTGARHIYAAAGFRLTSSKPMRNFGHDVVSEHWDLDLA